MFNVIVPPLLTVYEFPVSGRSRDVRPRFAGRRRDPGGRMTAGQALQIEPPVPDAPHVIVPAAHL